MKAYRLSDQNVFRTLNGLWTGKKEPLEEACVLRNTNFGLDGILDPSDVAKLQVERRHLDKRQLERGDIILERSGGSPKQPVGRVAFFDLVSSEPFSFSNFTSALRVLDRSLFDPRFVHYFLLDFYFEGGTKPLQSNTTGLRNLNFDSYLQTEVPCPPLAEQRKIAAVLGKVQATVAVEGDLVRVVRELKQAALRQFFTCGLRGEPQKQTTLGAVPESWQVVPLSQVASLTSGGTPSKGDPQNWNGAIPWATPKDMKRLKLADTIDHISERGLEAGSRLAPTGSLFVVIRGMILMRTVPVALACVPMAFNQDMKAIMAGSRISSEFLLYAFEANRAQLFALVGTSAHGTRTLMSSTLEEFSVPIPPEAEQREIAALLATLDAKIAHHEARQGLLRELFRTLLHDLLTARRRVTSLYLADLSIAP